MDALLDWRRILSESIVNATQFRQRFSGTDGNHMQAVCQTYPMRINAYYLSLIQRENDPFWQQAVPDERELVQNQALADPLGEAQQSPVPNLTHRYPDRLIFLVSDQCAVYCRFCMRKRRVGLASKITADTIAAGIEYIRTHPAITDVILSGGDPLMLSTDQLSHILQQLRQISHVEIIRIHTRAVCTLPQRVTPHLVQVLRKYHPLFINTHFNHPHELTPEVGRACGLLAEAGIPIGCQTVLLKGVNDNYPTMRQLFKSLLKMRIKPYYLHHPDPVQGTLHFRVPIRTGLHIMDKIRGHMSGLGVPQYMIDLPGGGGKIPLLPEYIKAIHSNKLVVRNYQNEIYEYPI